MSIDFWTIGLQAINVLVLLWLLRRFLYRPVQQVLEERRRQAASLIEQAREGQAKLATERAALTQERAELAALRDKAQAEAQTAAATERTRLLAKVEAEAAQRAAAAAAALDAERLAAQAAVTDEAAALAVDVTRRLLQQRPAAIAPDPFLQEICAEIAHLAPASRPIASDDLELITAHALSDAEQTRCRHDLQAALGCAPRLRFTINADLLAGVELRLPHAVIRSHWAQDLATIRDALRDHAHTA